MASTFYFQEQKLKPILQSFFNCNCDIDAVHTELRKGMRLLIHETIPYIWLSDGFNFIETHFTKDSMKEFRNNFSHVKFSSLREKIIYVSRWSLEIR
jgi:hypothetical protein